jgi:hypothetical protein
MGWVVACVYLLFVIVLLGVDLPEISFGLDSGKNVVYGNHGSQHGMVLVVVLVHSISANEEKVFEPVRVSHNLIEAIIGAEVSGVRFWYAEDARVLDVACVQDADFSYLSDGKIGNLRIIHFPKRVGVVAEVFEADPHLRWIRDEIGTPVVEDLEAAYENIRLLNVDPGVFDGRSVRLLNQQTIYKQANGNEVAIHETIGDRLNFGWHRNISDTKKLSNGHGREEIVAGYIHSIAGRSSSIDRGDAICAIDTTFDVKFGDLPSQADLTALFSYEFRGALPQLSWTIFGI